VCGRSGNRGTGDAASQTVPAERKKLPTKELYLAYQDWAKGNGYKALDNRSFVRELRHRLEIGRDGRLGNVALGLNLTG
jgi:phage/plasmid-associated DNA primase